MAFFDHTQVRDPSWRERSWMILAIAILLMPFTASQAIAHGDAGTPIPGSSPDCAQGDAATWTRQMDAYAAAGSYPATQTNGATGPSSVLVDIPPIAFTGDGKSATLPVGPCQTIYRFAYSNITSAAGDPGPFIYVEIDWNTEGIPRGPNGSFISPHFDFHFYMLSRQQIDQQVDCVSTNGRTCDPFQTSYTQTQLFQDLPDAEFIPSTYKPDIDSAIPEMGLHLLDMSIDYTVDNVNHYPTLIYGTFDSKVIFAESSVTLYTLQDAMAAPGNRISFPFRQPDAFAT
ncbi:MAG TPA: hypothetical protein VFQ54_00605, partial [Thermomicrobiales bacterium]|nr:hypothetical protein [Thermomicrobiales bacterium]